MSIANKMLSRLSIEVGKIDKRTAALASIALTLWLFGDSLIPLLWHGIHLAIEVVELAFEHFLEWAFGPSRRAAQTITFGTGFVLIVYGLFRLLRQTYVELRRAWDAALVQGGILRLDRRPLCPAHADRRGNQRHRLFARLNHRPTSQIRLPRSACQGSEHRSVRQSTDAVDAARHPLSRLCRPRRPARPVRCSAELVERRQVALATAE